MELCDTNEINRTEVDTLKQELEKEVKTYEGQYTIAGFIKKYLLSLPEPLFNHKMYSTFIESKPKKINFLSASSIVKEQERVEKLRTLVNQLSKIKRKTAKKVIGLLHKISLEEKTNQMNPENLGLNLEL
jgi:hypothetical protein